MEVEVVVIGGGHAGIEAALASARLGRLTLMLTISLDSIANMPCNPSIGGIAKGHLVREIDALGGEMGEAADATTIQSRMLNLSKGAAVQGLRVQIDRSAYHRYMKNCLEHQENLLIKQDEVVNFEVKSGKIHSVETKLGLKIKTKTVVVACGTFLNGRNYVGKKFFEGGPDGMPNSSQFSECLNKFNVPLRRFKTGTPARVNSRSINFEDLKVQIGDSNPSCFSHYSKIKKIKKIKNLVNCHITHTNLKTHDIILKNLNESAMFNGKIEGVGPRYCPSIEDKIIRFKEKQQHQIFIEPVGLETQETYLQGLSTSLSIKVQEEFLRTIKGLEEVEILRFAYAIEYDCCNPIWLHPTLESKEIEGFFGAGQFNGSSGYEEAAAQGIIAGINAARKAEGKQGLVLSRASSYIGTLIDDLTTKGCTDPYRMLTARSEFRLILRQDNADERLTPIGGEVGLITEERLEKFRKKQEQIKKELEKIKTIIVKPSEKLNAALKQKNTSELESPISLVNLIKRPQLSLNYLKKYVETLKSEVPEEIEKLVEIRIKYEGYVKKQEKRVELTKKLEEKKIPEHIKYTEIKGLRLEAAEKLEKIKPINLGQASRISGVNPADITFLSIWIKQNENKTTNQTN